MDVIRARALGTCFGVRDAISLALEDRFRDRLTVLGELVHNRDVLDQLEGHGVQRVRSPDDTLLGEIDTPAVLITAHGTSDSVKKAALDRGLEVHDATCPLVEKVHRTARLLESHGWHVAIVGRPGHVEVRGIMGDLQDASVVQGEADLAGLEGRPRVAFVAQSTEVSERFEKLVTLARERLEPKGTEIRAVDTSCAPTRERQAALRELAASCDLVIVVGDPTSNNSNKLAQTARSLGVEAHRVVGPDELRPEWFVGKSRCGLTAGTSTPDSAVDAVEDALHALAGTRRSNRLAV